MMAADRTVRKWALASALVVALLIPASQARGDVAILGPLLTTTAGVLAAGGGVTLTVVLVTNNSDEKDSEKSKEAYLRHRATALQQELTLGTGETIRELARTFHVEPGERGAFARMLHERRNRLVALTDLDRLDRQRAAKFFRIIARGMASTSVLRDDLRELHASTPSHLAQR